MPGGILALALVLAAAPLSPSAPPATPPAPAARIAVRAPASLLAGESIRRFAGWAARQGLRFDPGPEDAPVAPGDRVVRIAISPAAPDFHRRIARFGVRPEPKGFTFDGRAYRGEDDAIRVRSPLVPNEELVLGNGPDAALRLAFRSLFRDRDEDPDYRVVSGELAKSGRFTEGSGRLAIDRRSDRDEIAGREEFLRSLETTESDGVRWRVSPSGRSALAGYEAVLARFRRKGRSLPIRVTVFPDAVTKARLTGSSRPADVEREGNTLDVDLDASAPRTPDLVTPILAAAAYGSEDPRLLAHPVLLLALGARSAGRWWGRDVATFAAFTERARVGITAAEALDAPENTSPVLAVGTAAAWLDAGLRSEGEPAVLRLLAGDRHPLMDALGRWSAAARRVRLPAPPGRRPLPPGFLRGVSYAMSNSVDAGYISPRSRETLGRLSRLGANAVSIMPFSFMPDAGAPELSFIHRRPQGETDEGTVRAISDARALGMSSLLKPQIWVGGETFVGRIAMRSEADWRAWFDLYRRFAVHQALVAEAAAASMFCIGTELIDTEGRVADWRGVIAAVRLATGAPLTYAANWSGGAVRVPFWDALDAVGVDFYDPLSADPAATDAALEDGARAATKPLAELARRTGRPVVFTEAGFPLSRSSWTAPHDENTGRPSSASDAARAMAALSRALDGEGWWRGVFWWKAFSSGREAGAGDHGFNVLGGPPERVMAEAFAREAARRGR